MGPSEDLLQVASASPAGRFGPAQRVARSLGSRVGLAVLPDGRALLAADVPGSVRAFERPAGGSRFARVRLPGAGSASDGLAVALSPDGGAVVACRNDERSVIASLRPPGGAFGRWATVVPLARSSDDSLSVLSSAAASEDLVGRGLTAALGADGEVVLSWVDAAHGRQLATAYGAHGTLSGGMEPPQRLGGPCRSAAAATPVALADGQLAVAWIDNARARVITDSTLPQGAGRMHLAHSRPAGAPTTPSRASPRLAASLVGPRALEPGEQLRVRVRCEAACDVRVLARARSTPGSDSFDRGGGGHQAIWIAASTTLPAGGSAELHPPRLRGFNAAGVHDRPRTRIDVIACTPGGPLAQQLKPTPPRIADPPPVPRVIDLAAVRHGGTIRVTWRTTAPAKAALFTVSTTGRVDRACSRAADWNRIRRA